MPKSEIRKKSEIRSPKLRRAVSTAVHYFPGQTSGSSREAIARPLFPDDFAINDFASISSDRGKKRVGKIIDGKIMIRISDFGLLSDFGFRVSDFLSPFSIEPQEHS
jgi:hypothetical protein